MSHETPLQVPISKSILTFTHLPSIHPILIPSHTTYTTLTPHLLFSLAEISICVRVRARNTHFDPFTKLNLNSSLDRANSKTYNPWEMISRLQTIAKTVPFHPKLYKRSPVNRSPGILTETITASLLQGNHRMNSARLQV